MVTLLGLWQTVGMTKKREFPQHREDRKVQRLVERIVQQQALQAKAAQEKNKPPTKKPPHQEADLAQVRFLHGSFLMIT